MTYSDRNELTGRIIGCAIDVHRNLGPGLLESAYQRCLAYELKFNSIPFEMEVPMPVGYKGICLDVGYRIDIIINEQLIVELKSVKKINNLHKAQILTYMKLSAIETGLLINFNVPTLRNGLHRFVL